MVAEKILGNIQDKPQKKAIIPVAFEWFELEKKRIKKTAEDGTEFGISIPEVLKEGDILVEVKTAWDGKVLAQIPVEYTNVWKHYSTPVEMPDGVQALYFTFKGEGKGSLKGFYLEH